MSAILYNNASFTNVRQVGPSPPINLHQIIPKGGWANSTDSVFRVYETMTTEQVEQIPDSAALMFLAGAVLALAGFIAAWITDSGFATLALTLGLLLAAAGMRSAESAIHRHESK